MTPQELVALLKEDTIQGLSKWQSVIGSSTKEADIQALLTALPEVTSKAKSEAALTQVVDILLALTRCRHFNEKCLKAWLSTATNVVTKDCLQGASAIKLLDVMPLFLSYKESEFSPHVASWCRLVYQCLLNEDEAVRTAAVTVLKSQRESILGQKKFTAHVQTAIRNHLVTPLKKWFDCEKGDAALSVWSSVVEWLGDILSKSTPNFINSLLTIVEKGFRSTSPNIHCLSLETWKVFIDSMAQSPEKLKLPRSLKLLMTPLKSPLSPKVQVQLKGLRTTWYLARHLGSALPDVFEQVGLPLLKNITSFLTDERDDGSEDKHELNTECVFMIVRLLQPSAETDSVYNAATANIPVDSLHCSLSITLLSRHIAAFEKACLGAFIYLHRRDSIREEITSLLGHFLIHRALEAHNCTNTQVVSSILRLITQAIGKHFSPSTSMKILQEASQMPEGLLLSHCYYSGKSGVLHGTPALSLMELLFQPAIVTAFGCQKEYQVLFQRFMSVGMKGSSWLHFAKGVLMLLDHTPCADLPLGSMWLHLAQSLLTCVTSTQEVNQGNQLEHDFSTMVAVLCFPFQRVFSASSFQNKKEVMKMWTELYAAFVCCAALVPTVQPNTSCHEFCHTLYMSLTPTSKENILYVELVGEALALVSEHITKSALARTMENGITPPKWDTPARHRNTTALGNLHWYVCVLAWCLEGTSVAEQKLRDTYTTEPSQVKNALLTSVQTSLRLAQQLFQFLRMSIHVEEALKLLGPPLTPLFAVTKSKLASKGFASSISPKLEAVWSALVTCTTTHYLGARDGSLLPVLGPLLESSILHPRPVIHERAMQLWQALFGQATTPLNVPSSLREVLQKARSCLLPNFVPVDDCVSNQATCSTQDELFIPDAKLPTSAKMATVATSFPVKVSPSVPTTPKRKKLRLEDIKDEEFVLIESPSAKRSVLTEHQKEVLRERKPLPALYSNLSQDAAMSFSETQDSDTVEMTKAVEGAHEEVVVLDTEEELKENEQERKLTAKVDKTDGEKLGSSEETGIISSTPTECVVPESENCDPQALVPTEVRVLLGKIDMSPCTSIKVSQQSPHCEPGSSSPKVHKPKRRLSFAQKPSIIVEEEAEAANLSEEDIVPSSQSVGSSEELESLSSKVINTSECASAEKIIQETQCQKSECKSPRGKKVALKTQGKRMTTRVRKSEKVHCELENVLLPEENDGKKNSAACNIVYLKAASSDNSVPRKHTNQEVMQLETPTDDAAKRKNEAVETLTEKDTENAVENLAADISGSRPVIVTHNLGESDTDMINCQSTQDITDSALADSKAESKPKSLKRKRRSSRKGIEKVTKNDTVTEGIPHRHTPPETYTDREGNEEKASVVAQPATESNCKSVISSMTDCACTTGSGNESELSRESSTWLQGPSVPGKEVCHSRRLRKNQASARLLEAGEPDRLSKRAKLGSPADTGTKSIKSYFFSVVEPPRKEQESSWDNLLNVEKELHPEDGVSPLPHDEILESSNSFLGNGRQSYSKQSTCASNENERFDALLSHIKDGISEDYPLANESQQTQPYEIISNFELTRNNGDKELLSHPFVSGTEETQPCYSEAVEVASPLQKPQHICVKEQNVLEGETFGQCNGHHEQEGEDVCLLHDVDTPQSMDGKEVQNSDYTEPFELTPKTVDRCIVATCAKDFTATEACQSTDVPLSECIPSASPVEKVEETVLSPFSTMAENAGTGITTTDEGQDGFTLVSSTDEICEPPQNGAIYGHEQTTKGDIAEDGSSLKENKPNFPAADKFVTRNDVDYPVEEKIMALTEAEVDDPSHAEWILSSPSTKVCGAKKRKLPFQRISPVATRLRSRNVRLFRDDALSSASNPGDMPGGIGSPERVASPSKKPPWPGGASCPSPLSRSQKMVDAAIKRAVELSPSSKARSTLESVSDGDPRGFVGILKKQVLPNGEASSPRHKRHVSFADPIIQGEYQIQRRPNKRCRSLNSLYAPKEEDLADEVIENSQAQLCEQLACCRDPIEKIIPFITTGTWASGLCHYFEQQSLRTVGDLSSLRPPQVLSIPVKPPKVATLREGLQAYCASLSTMEAPEENDEGQEQETELSNAENIPSKVTPSAPSASDSMSDIEVPTSENKTQLHKSDVHLQESNYAATDVDALCDVLIQLTPEAMSRLPYEKHVALLDSVVQGLKFRAGAGSTVS